MNEKDGDENERKDFASAASASSFWQKASTSLSAPSSSSSPLQERNIMSEDGSGGDLNGKAGEGFKSNI